ncbi:MAG TPA: hypothetical protein V6D07_10625 [Trichocoleus sp.]
MRKRTERPLGTGLLYLFELRSHSVICRWSNLDSSVGTSVSRGDCDRLC